MNGPPRDLVLGVLGGITGAALASVLFYYGLSAMGLCAASSFACGWTVPASQSRPAVSTDDG